MRVFEYDLRNVEPVQIGLIALQTDERIEQDFRKLLPPDVSLLVSRVPSGLDVSPETLKAMEAHIPDAAGLLPQAAAYGAIGYGCTSGAAHIGAARVAEQIRRQAVTAAVSDPLTALIAACNALKVKRLALLSPYVENVSDGLRTALKSASIETPVFGSFAEAEEARVVRIAPSSIQKAGADLVRGTDVDALFLSCTNLDTLDVIAPLSEATGLPVLSSNQVLVWHLCTLAGVSPMPVPAMACLNEACRNVPDLITTR